MPVEIEQLFKSLQQIAPASYRSFKKGQSLPYIVYFIDDVNREASDCGDVGYFEKTLVIQLCTKKKDLELESRLEQLISDYDYSGYEDFLETEGIFVNTYEVLITEK